TFIIGLIVPKDITTTKIQSGSTSTLLTFGSDSNTIFINIILLADSLNDETVINSPSTKKKKVQKRDTNPRRTRSSTKKLQSQQEQSKDLNHHTKTIQKRNSQEPLEEYSSSDVEIINSIPTKTTRLSSPNILSEDETTSQNPDVTNLASPKNHIPIASQHEMTSTNSTLHSSIEMQVLQNQESLLQKKPEEVRQEIGNVAIPTQFQNEFEIAYWLAHHKRILDLAANIRNGMMTRTDEGDDSALPSQQFSYELLSTPVEIDQHKKFQLQEECKALFIRTRNNTQELYEELISRVCKISKTDSRIGALLKDVGGWYNTYRCKFHVAVVKLADDFIVTHENAVEPYDELNEFITEDVWRRVLCMHLKATDQQKLKKDEAIITKLGIFMQQVVKAVIIAQKNSRDTQPIIKKYDEHTIDLKIPTKLGVVESLPVRELLN
ncbi:17623_t:CDS:2, partial [Rhizophagus irregularis]